MIVVKIGGSIAGRCPGLLDELASHPSVVLVHGFGPQTDAAVEARGIEQRTIRSPEGVTSRFTDEAVLQAMGAAAERVGQAVVEALAQRYRPAEHLGVDVPILWGQAKPALRHVTEEGRVMLVRGNRSGRVREVATEPVRQALANDRVPVVTPLALDGHGPLSVDADRAAAALAGALGAEALLLLTDVAGFLEDPTDPASRVEALSADEIEALIGQGARGGMVRKLVAAGEALEAGVGRVLIGSGLGSEPVARALAGEATEVVP